MFLPISAMLHQLRVTCTQPSLYDTLISHLQPQRSGNLGRIRLEYCQKYETTPVRRPDVLPADDRSKRDCSPCIHESTASFLAPKRIAPPCHVRR